MTPLPDAEPTAFPFVNTTLAALHSAVHTTLGAQFAGLYLYGSLASGDFTPSTSDIDFLVVTADDLAPDDVARLATMHAQLAALPHKGIAKLEGSYLPRHALARYDPAGPAYPTLNEGRFYTAPHGPDWILQRHILREHGVTVCGPPIRPLIEPVTPDALRDAVTSLLNGWWATLADSPQRLSGSDYQAFATLSMCRALHTLASGTIATKPAAARWAQARLSAEQAALIEAALNWRPGQTLDRVDDVVALIRFTVAAANR